MKSTALLTAAAAVVASLAFAAPSSAALTTSSATAPAPVVQTADTVEVAQAQTRAERRAARQARRAERRAARRAARNNAQPAVTLVEEPGPRPGTLRINGRTCRSEQAASSFRNLQLRSCASLRRSLLQ